MDGGRNQVRTNPRGQHGGGGDGGGEGWGGDGRRWRGRGVTLVWSCEECTFCSAFPSIISEGIVHLSLSGSAVPLVAFSLSVNPACQRLCRSPQKEREGERERGRGREGGRGRGVQRERERD